MKKRLILIVAIILGLASSVTVYKYLEKGKEVRVVQELVPVVVAAKEIQPKERILVDQVAVKRVPRDMAHFEAATSVDQVVGFFARDGIIAGEQILIPKLIKGFADYGIVIKIPAGRRAMTIPVDPVVGVAGFVRPGDYVDVLAGFNESIVGENISKVILQKVLVLATDQELAEDKREPVESTTVTVAVTLEEAEQLAMALDHGTVRIALRPLDSEMVDPVKVLAAQNEKVAVPKANVKTSSTPKPLSQFSNLPKSQVKSEQTAVTSKGPYEVEVIRGTERSTVTVENGKEGVSQ